MSYPEDVATVFVVLEEDPDSERFGKVRGWFRNKPEWPSAVELPADDEKVIEYNLYADGLSRR